jgi:hypothetical protein
VAKQNTFATSTFQILKPESYQTLEGRFTLIRYVIPESFRGKSKKERYKLLHVELRGQLDVPYRTYEHDVLDRAERYVIYALYPKGANVAAVTITFLSNDSLEQRQIAFHEISTFNVIKLLQADYFNTYPHFASMGNYFVHAKQSRNDWHTCLGITIRGANQNIKANYIEETQQEFWVTGQARYFNRPQKHPDEYQKRRYPYYKRQMREGYVIFEQLPFDQIDSYRGQLFQQYSKQSNPARLVYHAQNARQLLPSRGYLLHQFTTRFVEKLQALGIPAQIKQRTWTQYLPSKHVTTLPQRLKQIFLFDNRQNRAKHPITAYQACLAEHYSAYKFVVIQTLDQALRQPVLILQDTDAEDYEEDGLLFDPDTSDPYKVVYRQFPNVPKQSINVNENSQGTFKGSLEAYLDYPMITLTEVGEEVEEIETETGWAIQFQVSFHQLYLKDVVINQRPVSTYLPLSGNLSSLMSYIYIRKQTFRSVSYHVAVRVENDHLVFHDLRDPEQKNALSEITLQWGYDWLDIEENLFRKRHKKKEDEDEVKDYDLILMPKRAVELETVDETVIYKYSEIEQRLGIRTAKQLIESLYLLPHYDRLRATKDTISQFDLESLGLLDERKPNAGRETKSVQFWQKLQEYDHLLADLRIIQSRISYDEFVEMRRDEIGNIFKFPKTARGEYNTNQLLEFYKVIWGIGGFKSDDVQMSKGIWYDLTDFAYTVGDVNGFNEAQDRANLVRRFDVLHGDRTGFNIQEFLEATAVQFIRYRQYTVYPYPFYLIEKYIQDVLYHL